MGCLVACGRVEVESEIHHIVVEIEHKQRVGLPDASVEIGIITAVGSEEAIAEQHCRGEGSRGAQLRAVAMDNTSGHSQGGVAKQGNGRSGGVLADIYIFNKF